MIVAGVLVLVCALITAVAFCCLKPKGYTYQGKTVEEWFGEYRRQFFYPTVVSSDAESAFFEMGTNALPFLTSQIKQDLEPSLLEVWAQNLPKRFTPERYRRAADAHLAEVILASMRTRGIEIPPP
jgi:hypothetical protein